MMYYASICVPMFVWVIGLILAGVRWKQSPRASMFAIGGMLAMLLTGVIEAGRIALLGVSPLDFGGDLYIFLLQAINVGHILFEVIGGVLILFAIFSGREVIQSES